MFNSGENIARVRTTCGMSQKALAAAVGVSLNTIKSWEANLSAPTVNQTEEIYTACNAQLAREISNINYPDMCRRDGDPDPETVRQMLITLFRSVLSDSACRQTLYNCMAENGSDIEAQVHLNSMYNHLPLSDKSQICAMMIYLYELRKDQGLLINPESCPPDIELVKRAHNSARRSVLAGKNSYITMQEE